MSRQSLISINTRETSATKQVELGTKYEDEFGRIYRYVKAGASALSPGKLVVNSDVNADAVNKTVARTTAVGELSVIVDVGGTIVADAYVDGQFTISDATGEGVSYRVTGNTGVTGAGEITVYLAEPLKVALTIDVSEYTLTLSPWDSVVVSATDQADMPVGVPNITIALSEYGWVQTRGECSVWADTGGFAKGKQLTIGGATAGGVEDVDAAGEPLVGVAIEAGTATEYRVAFLMID